MRLQTLQPHKSKTNRENYKVIKIPIYLGMISKGISTLTSLCNEIVTV